jgi:hypothetical protein
MKIQNQVKDKERFSIVAPCNELVDTWCRVRIRLTGLLSFGPEMRNLVEV